MRVPPRWRRAIDGGIALRDFLEVRVDERVAGDVQPQRHVDAARELEHRSHDRRNREPQEARRMFAGHRRDAHVSVAFRRCERVPRVERHRALKAEPAKCGRRVLRGDDRQVAVEPLADEVIEVIAVHVREHDEVDRRQLLK